MDGKMIEPGKIYWMDGDVVFPPMTLKIVKRQDGYYLENAILALGPFEEWGEAARMLAIGDEQPPHAQQENVK